jgi:hypothetical protein
MTTATKKKSEKAVRTRAGKRARTPALAASSTAAARKAKSHSRVARPQCTKPTSKRDQIAAMLVRDQGATVAQMREATGWLPHTVRAALTGLKKLGYAIDSDKVDGLRTYRAVAPN